MPGERARPAGAASKTRLRLWLRLLKLTRGIESDLRDHLRREFDSTLPRFDVMSALSRRPGGLKMSEISGLLKVSNGNVTGIVERLAADGLAIREVMPGDRRAARVRLTAEGRDEFARQAAAHEVWIDTVLEGFDIATAEGMIRGIDEMMARGEASAREET
ncbi:MAG: MarR family transcriptional regulator [Rhodobacteraceae bacterium]|nr:MarR family transcriptional regulator [Paracoccaceae bacterium]